MVILLLTVFSKVLEIKGFVPASFKVLLDLVRFFRGTFNSIVIILLLLVKQAKEVLESKNKSDCKTVNFLLITDLSLYQ